MMASGPMTGISPPVSFGNGVLATLPMTLWMWAANRWIPASQPDSLPPEEITANLIEKTQPEERLSREQKRKISILNHFFYGGVLATLFGLGSRYLPESRTIPGGIAYGLAVWSGNYLGLLPVVRLYPSATDEPPRMNGIMLIAHIIWGGALGWLFSKTLPSKTAG